MTNTGKYQQARDNIHNKAQKAMYNLMKCSKGCDIPPKLAMELFDKLVKPILIYGSEVLTVPDNTQNLDRKTIEEVYSDDNKSQNPGEKVSLHYARFVLGVHKKTASLAIRGELGLYPVYIDMIVHHN